MVNSRIRTLVTLLFAALFGTLALSLSIGSLTFFVSDDAYYYLNVARNIVRGAGSSFDGMDPTNGYHPLWMLCLLPVYWLFGDSPGAALRATMLLQVLMVAATLWLAWDTYRRFRANALSVMVAIALALTLFSPLQMMFNGLETDLVVLLLVLIVHEDAKRRFLAAHEPGAHQGLFGLLLGLLVLARLDEAFLLVGIAVWSLIRMRPLPFTRRIVSLWSAHWRAVAAFAVVVMPYFLWNFAEFGHLTPISGALKTTFPHPTFRPAIVTAYAPYVVGTLIAGLALVATWRRAETPIPRPNLDLLTGLWIGCLIQVGWAVFFTIWGTFQWHFAAHVPTVILILSIYAAQVARHPRPALTVSAAIALAVGVIVFNVHTYDEKGDYHAGSYTAALWARANTPGDSVFALADAGLFGYFSERPTINLDGLINSYQYQYDVRAGRLMEFLRDRRVGFIADAFAPCSYSERHVWVRSFLPPRPPLTVAYGLTVARDQEVFRSAASVFMPLTIRRPYCFIVWPFDTVTLEVRDPTVRLGQR
jgi:hypothetical protein